MKPQGEGGEEPQRTDASPHQTATEAHEEAFDEPDDELEEFDEIGWDDEDADDEFLERLQRELEAFKTNYASKTSQVRKAA
ncbi:hypothetical protein, conserved [Eimeria acervulina]|uniref:Uncharacterized protein n=1 Tax=Eimeria acervulina TaxID=5801 RepID=U6GP82_EIMAC|nr:hypothetical protein, conserved [Eimeria acervulina]CDI81397.1 hypothetical protein, conserved [Eimeria acervulina]